MGRRMVPEPGARRTGELARLFREAFPLGISAVVSIAYFHVDTLLLRPVAGDEAVGYWEIVWAADPDFEQVRENLTQEYLARGMEDYAGGALHRAVASWEEALRVDPDDTRARGYLERARQQLSRMEKISANR